VLLPSFTVPEIEPSSLSTKLFPSSSSAGLNTTGNLLVVRIHDAFTTVWIWCVVVVAHLPRYPASWQTRTYQTQPRGFAFLPVMVVLLGAAVPVLGFCIWRSLTEGRGLPWSSLRHSTRDWSVLAVNKIVTCVVFALCDIHIGTVYRLHDRRCRPYPCLRHGVTDMKEARTHLYFLMVFVIRMWVPGHYLEYRFSTGSIRRYHTLLVALVWYSGKTNQRHTQQVVSYWKCRYHNRDLVWST
jgi:hypothetical protein